MKNINIRILSEESIRYLIKRITFLYFAHIGGILIFLFVIIYLVEGAKTAGSTDLNSVLLMAVPTIAVSCAIAAYFLSVRMINKARAASDEDKLMLYHSAYLVRYALLEGPSLFSIVGYFLTGDRLYLVVLAVMLAILSINKPSIHKFHQEMSEPI